jgi:hypothetical protein
MFVSRVCYFLEELSNAQRFSGRVARGERKLFLKGARY